VAHPGAPLCAINGNFETEFPRGSMAGTIGGIKTSCESSDVPSRFLRSEAFSMTSWHSVRDGQLILAFIAASPSCSSPVLR
jgi:hypothetical protein